MKNKTDIRSSLAQVNWLPADPSAMPSSSSGLVGTSFSIVQSGPIVRGNRKTPNPWSYDIYEFNTPIGLSSRTYYETWTDGQDPPTYLHGYGKQEQLIASPLLCGDVNGLSAELSQRAQEDAYNKMIESARGSVDLSIDLFQARQTAKMLNAVDRFRDRFESTPYGSRFSRSRTRPSAKGIAREMGSKWLEWTYGWSPLLSTIHDTIEETLRYHCNNTVKVKGRRSLSQNGPVQVTSGTPNGTIQHTLMVSAFAKSQYVIEMSVVDNDLSRLTSLNPVSIAWELVPYSFVVDWFYDIGSYLRGVETAALYGSRFVGGYSTMIRGSKCSTSAVRFETLQGSNGEQISDRFSSNSREVHFSRNVLTSMPFPKAPKLNLDLSSGRLLNAAGLLSQFLKR